MATNDNIAQGEVLIGQPSQSNPTSVSQLLCKTPVPVNQKMPWPQENHKLQVFICFPNSSFSVSLNVLGQCIRQKVLEVGEEQSPPTQGHPVIWNRPGARRGDVARVTTWENTAQVHVLRDPQTLDGRRSVFHSDSRSTRWGGRICFSTRWWHSIIVFLAMTDLAERPRNNWLLGCHRSRRSDGEPNRVVFLSWQRKNLIKTVSDLQMSEANKTITTAFLTAVAT